jgi:hypothetical protein
MGPLCNTLIIAEAWAAGPAKITRKTNACRCEKREYSCISYEVSMQHTDQRAAGDAYSAGNSATITRRRTLRWLAGVSVAAAVPKEAVDTLPEMSPKDLMAHHLAEYQKAAEMVDPGIRFWRVADLTSADPTLYCALVISAFRRS